MSIGDQIMTDRYTKTILTIIAIALVGIGVKLWEPTPAYAGLMTGPTVEDIRTGRVKPIKVPAVFVINMK
jgi:hypothetical protein